jgi:excisionase family DNA binding protein
MDTLMKHLPIVTQEQQNTALLSAKTLAELQQKNLLNPQSGAFVQIENLLLPAGALELLKEILDVMAVGKSVMVLPAEEAMLSTQEVADLLQVSRPYIVKLIDKGDIPHQKVGKHRQVALVDALAYKNAMHQDRENHLAILAEEAQKLNLGYTI